MKIYVADVLWQSRRSIPIPSTKVLFVLKSGAKLLEGNTPGVYLIEGTKGSSDISDIAYSFKIKMNGKYRYLFADLFNAKDGCIVFINFMGMTIYDREGACRFTNLQTFTNLDEAICYWRCI